MKKYLVIQLIALLPLFLFAQDLVLKGSRPITKQYTPKEVIDSLAKRFPNAESVKYYKTTLAHVDSSWAVTAEDNLQHNSEVDYYTISFKQEGLQYYGLYANDGTLLECKFEQKVDQLPEPVVASLKSIAKDYPGYKVTAKSYFKEQNYSKSKEYYQVTASNGTEKKHFYYTADGQLKKVKKG
jgi:hypothetical protein